MSAFGVNFGVLGAPRVNSGVVQLPSRMILGVVQVPSGQTSGCPVPPGLILGWFRCPQGDFWGDSGALNMNFEVSGILRVNFGMVQVPLG